MTLESANPALEPQFLPRIGRHLAHELNNPISAISSAAFLIQDFIDTAEGGMLDTEMVKPFIESIREECNKLKNTVEEFAKYVTTESILPTAIDLGEFLRTRAGELNSERLAVQFIEPAAKVEVEADTGHLQQALRALAAYAEQSGATTLRIEASTGKECSITLYDNRAQKLTEEERKDVFNPLPTKRTPGLGLKLPLVRRVIELHGGSISIETPEGKEARVCIQLPLVQS